MTLTTDHKGAIAESAVVHAAVKIGLGVSIPLAPQRYDLVLDVGSRLLRVQCKWAARDGGVVVVRCYTSRRDRGGFVHRGYDAEEIDAVAAYCAELDRCYLIPVSVLGGQRNVQLRLEPAANNQERGIRWADRYELGSVDWDEFRLSGP